MYLLLRSLVKHQSESKNTDDLIQSVIHDVSNPLSPCWFMSGNLNVAGLWLCIYDVCTLFCRICFPQSVILFFFQSIFPGSWIKKAYGEIQKAIEIQQKALWKGNVMVDGIRENNINQSRQLSEIQQALNVTFVLKIFNIVFIIFKK